MEKFPRMLQNEQIKTLIDTEIIKTKYITLYFLGLRLQCIHS